MRSRQQLQKSKQQAKLTTMMDSLTLSNRLFNKILKNGFEWEENLFDILTKNRQDYL